MQPLNEKFALLSKDGTYPELLELPGEAGEVELPDGPGEPVADVLLGPGLGIPRHLEPFGVLAPRGVRLLQRLVYLLVGARRQWWDLLERRVPGYKNSSFPPNMLRYAFKWKIN